MTDESNPTEDVRAVGSWMIDFDPLREDAIDRLTDGEAVVMVDGVAIDFTHADLPAGQYRPVVDWWTAENSAGLRGPWNVIPEDRSQYPDMATANDRVRITRITEADIPIQQTGDAPADSVGFNVYLVIEKPDGTSHWLTEPLWFLRRDSLIEIDPAHAGDVLKGRLDHLIEAASGTPEKGSYLVLASHYADYLELLCATPTDGSAEETLGTAMLFGYALARAEASAPGGIGKLADTGSKRIRDLEETRAAKAEKVKRRTDILLAIASDVAEGNASIGITDWGKAVCDVLSVEGSLRTYLPRGFDEDEVKALLKTSDKTVRDKIKAAHPPLATKDSGEWRPLSKDRRRQGLN